MTCIMLLLSVKIVLAAVKPLAAKFREPSLA